MSRSPNLGYQIKHWWKRSPSQLISLPSVTIIQTMTGSAAHTPLARAFWHRPLPQEFCRLEGTAAASTCCYCLSAVTQQSHTENRA